MSLANDSILQNKHKGHIFIIQWINNLFKGDTKLIDMFSKEMQLPFEFLNEISSGTTLKEDLTEHNWLFILIT